MEVLQCEQSRPDAREQPGEVEGVGGEGDEGPKAEDAVRVRPEEVRLVRVQVGGLDQSGGEVVGEIAVDQASPQVTIAEMWTMYGSRNLAQVRNLDQMVNLFFEFYHLLAKSLISIKQIANGRFQRRD